MRELSLFSGGGGGLLASRLLGWETCGYVEWDPYCQELLAARIRDGFLSPAPIFGDIRTFVGDGYAAGYQDLVDVVSGGFPCQPFSLAGKQAGADDPRNMWPATLDVLRAVRPRFAFLENVPGLLTSGYFGTILRGLAEEGFDAVWRVLGAGDCGAPHERQRLWLLAYAAIVGRGEGRTESGVWGRHSGSGGKGSAATLADADGERSGEERRLRPGKEEWAAGSSEDWWRRDPADGADPAQPVLGRVADGVAYRVDRLRALGNGQVPAVAVAAWKTLRDAVKGARL